MKLNIDYTGDPRWAECSKIHKETLLLPNVFLNVIYKYQNEISGLSEINSSIETGTHDARSSKFFSEHFDTVFTIEKFTERNPYDGINYTEVYKKINETYENITFLNGDSPEVMKSIFEELPNERFLILLDAHSMENGPLKEELTSIRDYSNNKNHVIIIDDCNHLGLGSFPTLDEMTTILKEINPNYNIINTKEGNGIFLVF
jgi:hypothetical protein